VNGDLYLKRIKSVKEVYGIIEIFTKCSPQVKTGDTAVAAGTEACIRCLNKFDKDSNCKYTILPTEGDEC
jgi:hypothetical protein